ncbi:SCP-2 sterol transfer family protein [Amycolatopsis marina]|uniref:SCP-2 sterol transfer family protein n=1 Tax=Amycolatopsis marina TaxID=490629 RepID=A0A1I0VSI9_9PSEU|nr:SCP2 sterol-binding domain-containing protein [Amycolatopsis marina]SFA79242.1 SCP-2 sterol transfer family protein [Amycolatopsis marina]
MAERTGVSVADLTAVRGVAQLDLLERADPAGLDPALDADTVLGSVDLATLGKDGFRRLLLVLTRLEPAAPALSLGRVGPRRFATLVGRASRAQLDRVLAEPALCARVLDEIFARMSAQLKPDRARDLVAVVHWRFSGGTGDGGYDRVETVIRDSACVARRELREQPRVTITIAPADFVKLVTRQTTPAVLFVTGRIKVKGDLAFAAGLIGFFDLPRAD